MNRLLEEYVEEVRAGLRGMSKAKRDEEVAELRQHLEAMVEDRKMRGIQEEQAASDALRSFGNARRLRRGLTRAALRAAIPRAGDTTLLAAVYSAALAAFAVREESLFALPPLHSLVHLLLPSGTPAVVVFHAEWERAVFLAADLRNFLTGVLLGLPVAVLAPRRAAQGVVSSWALLSLTLLLGLSSRGQHGLSESTSMAAYLLPTFAGMLTAAVAVPQWGRARFHALAPGLAARPKHA